MRGLPMRVGAATFGALVALSSSAFGEESVFLRTDDLGTLSGGDLEANYSLESGRNFADPNEAEFGLRHRLHVAYGITDWLGVSVEQSLKHLLEDDALRVGVFVPEVRLSLGPLLPDSIGAWPVDLGVFFAPRIRVEARRDPSLHFGLGTNRRAAGGLQFTANLGLEITVPAADGSAPTNYGPRYDAGIGWALGGGIVLSAEVWGHAAWIDSWFLEQEHHLGPSVVFLIGPVRAGFNVAAGLRQRAAQSMYADFSGMLSVGFRL
ncbi:MAG: hypothetical protein HY905_11525 [Deltaproteobacteria bacterium]|nr:hypothetical protein [Deltaproteobacteria bacterium]